MVVPPHGGPADLNAFLDSKVHATVGYYYVSTFAEGRDDGRDGGEPLGIEDGSFSAKEFSDVALKVHVHICPIVINY